MARAGKPLDHWQREPVDALCAVDEATGRWAVKEHCEICPRQNGKGVIGEARVLGGFFIFGEPLILWSAHETKTSGEAFRRFRRLIAALGTPLNDRVILVDEAVAGSDVRVKFRVTNGEMGFERLDTGQRVLFIARSKGSGRGFTAEGVTVLDEAYALTPEHMEAQAPTGLAVANSQTIYLSSPPLSGDTGEILYAIRRRAESGATTRLSYRDWGLGVDLEDFGSLDLDSRELWAQTNPAYPDRITDESMEDMRAQLAARDGIGFARECLCLWPREARRGGAIDMKKWSRMTDSKSTRDDEKPMAVGFFVEPDMKWAAIAIWAERADGLHHTALVSVVRGTDKVVPTLVELRNMHNPMGFCTNTATYKALKPELELEGLEVPYDPKYPDWGDVLVMSGADSATACQQLLDSVARTNFRHLGDPDLNASAETVSLKRTTDAVVWARGGDDESGTCPISAVTAARWLWTQWQDKVSDDGPGVY